MRSLSVTMVVLVAMSAAHVMADTLWVEGEKAALSSWRRHSWFAETRRDADGKNIKIDTNLFSGRRWLSHWDKQPGEAQFGLDIPSDGDYSVLVRGVMAARIKWRVDDGEWQRVDLSGKGLQPVVLGEGPRRLAWKEYGKVKLSAGRHTFAFLAEVHASGPQEGVAFGGLDCFVLSTGGFEPDGRNKPGDAVDMKVFAPATDESGWFDFTAEQDDFAESVLDVSHLLDAPAGKHGMLGMEEGDFVFADGTKIKFLGTNLCNAQPGMDKETSRKAARRFAKYGINSVRFHKFCHPGEAVKKGATTSTELDPGYMDCMDALHAELKKNGVYVGWSPIYGHKVVAGDGVLAFDEIKKLGGKTSGLVNFAPDLQDVHIKLLTNLLNHRNPYTGLRYADDPALTFVEIQNEDDVFWNYRNQVNACPTYKQMLYDQFQAWLKKKYKTEEAQRAAWGEKAMSDSEGLITMHGWWYTEDAYDADRSYLRKKTLDAARFLYETQNNFYSRAVAAIRGTGYKGPIIGSCWKASAGVGHFYNLHSDALVGLVDRHSYFGGGGQHRLRPGAFSNASQLRMPGSGILGMGVQQVRTRPFTISEWLTLMPTMWVAEGQAILGAYGMCLQDWDGIFMFASSTDYPPKRWDNPRVYTADQPAILGANPALAYWVYRGDIAPASTAVRHKIRIEDLLDGKLTVRDKMVDEGDIKALAEGGSTPRPAFAIGRVTVEFVEDDPGSEVADLGRYWDEEKKVVRSNTGELLWDYSGDGFFTVDTARSKAVCGFVRGKDLALGDVRLTEIDNRFIALYLSSVTDGPIGKPGRILLTALARTRNKGMAYNADETQLLAVGKGPMQLEAVRVTITLPGSGQAPVVNVLDHYGRRTGRTVPVRLVDGRPTFRIDETYKTLYYEVVVR